MKVLLINNYHFRRGGADVVYLNTGKLLSENNHQVCYFSTHNQQNELTSFSKYFINMKVDTKASIHNKIRNSLSYYYNIEAVNKLELLIQTERPDIAHIHLYIGGMTSSILKVLRKNSIPVVYTAHDYRLVCPAYAFLDAKGKICEACKGKYFYKCAVKKCSKNSFLQSAVMSTEMYYRNLFYNPLKYIDGFIFVSDFSYMKHLQYLKGLRTKQILRLYNFIKIDKPVVCHSDYFLYYGRISQEKGIFTLVEAMRDIQECKLKIVGDGPQVGVLKDYCEKNHLKNIEFIGFLKGVELATVIKEAKFVILPSEWYENNPLTIIESYSFTTPVIGADIAGISEIITNGKTGYLFRTGDSKDLCVKIRMANSISHEDYCEMSLNSYNFAKEHFNTDINIEKLIEFYKTIIMRRNDKKNY